MGGCVPSEWMGLVTQGWVVQPPHFWFVLRSGWGSGCTGDVSFEGSGKHLTTVNKPLNSCANFLLLEAAQAAQPENLLFQMSLYRLSLSIVPVSQILDPSYDFVLLKPYLTAWYSLDKMFSVIQELLDNDQFLFMLLQEWRGFIFPC